MRSKCVSSTKGLFLMRYGRVDSYHVRAGTTMSAPLLAFPMEQSVPRTTGLNAYQFDKTPLESMIKVINTFSLNEIY